MLRGCLLIADLTELQLPSNININFPEGKEKPMHFEISIKPDEGYYRCGSMHSQRHPEQHCIQQKTVGIAIAARLLKRGSCVGQGTVMPAAAVLAEQALVGEQALQPTQQSR
jgi:hypothetical protein